MPAWLVRLAIDSSRLRIYIINADGSGLVNLTNDAANDWGPAWSAR